MPDVYTAPTYGHEIRPTHLGGLRINMPGMDYVGGHEPQTLVAGRVKSLREYFRDERDQELGRWRWPENPDYVVRELTRDRVRVVNEVTGIVNDVRRGTNPPRNDHSPEAAKAYFDAHPEKKPWHDAKPGEVWVITTENVADEVAVQRTDTAGWQYNDGFVLPDREITIETARRIWPESKES